MATSASSLWTPITLSPLNSLNPSGLCNLLAKALLQVVTKTNADEAALRHLGRRLDQDLHVLTDLGGYIGVWGYIIL